MGFEKYLPLQAAQNVPLAPNLHRWLVEGRPYNRFFHAFLDPKDYLQRYPDLNLRDAGDAVRHWMRSGRARAARGRGLAEFTDQVLRNLGRNVPGYGFGA